REHDGLERGIGRAVLELVAIRVQVVELLLVRRVDDVLPALPARAAVRRDLGGRASRAGPGGFAPSRGSRLRPSTAGAFTPPSAANVGARSRFVTSRLSVRGRRCS